MDDESGKSTERCDRCRKKKVRDRDRNEAGVEKRADCRDKTKYIESSDTTEREKISMMLADKQKLHDAAGETHTEGSNQG